jgi:spore maturation protein CgeB
LTEPAPLLENWYVPDLEIAVFQSDQELVQKIKFYLSQPDIRDRIAAAGFKRTSKDHTYEKRLQLVLSYALQAKEAEMQNPGEQPARPEKRRVPLYTGKPVPSKTEQLIRLIRWVLVWGCSRIWGQGRGLRAARRIVFELSWRLAKEKTFSRSGWPARMFPEL